METLLYAVALALVKGLQTLPLPWVARIGRVCGGITYWLDFRHRRVAQKNLTRCFGNALSPSEIRALARENFRRIGENYCSAIKTAAMSWPELAPYVEIVGTERFTDPAPGGHRQSCVVAIGHFGNFELYARFHQFRPGYQIATTYRALKQPSLNRLLRSLRERSGCLYFERRTQGGALKAAMAEQALLLGLLADQHAGARGIQVPLFGHVCSTTAAPAVFALRYRCPLYTGICYRVGLGRWRIEAGEEIPTRQEGRARTVEAITADINQAFEAAIRRDPANWFWVHNRWKRSSRNRTGRAPAAAPSPNAPPSSNTALTTT